MPELLAPAGNMKALKAAIANGCDAVYLGMRRFGARAYSSNFDEEQLIDAVAYAHLRDVRVYVTVNTIVFEDELSDVEEQLIFLNSIGVDAVIVQDLAVLDFVAARFPDMEAHCSTQMGIDDVEGALLAKELGGKRIVLAREAPIHDAKRIQREAGMPVEVFCHGAICIAYSGNCLMSSMIGDRSGNRGRCIGSCRKRFHTIDADTGTVIDESHILSAKDLCTIDHIEDLREMDSLKIEGRMREAEYVANVVSRYRLALDRMTDEEDIEKLSYTFNRSYTKGFLFDADRGEISNPEKPNNFGYRIGVIDGTRRGMYRIRLEKPIAQNDLIRIRHGENDVDVSVVKLFDGKGMLVNGADDECFLKLKEALDDGDVVYKTRDVLYTKDLANRLDGEYRRFELDFTIFAQPGDPLLVKARSRGLESEWVGEEPLSEARNRPTSIDDAIKQLDRLNDTIFSLGEVELTGENAFIPAKMFNSARRSLVESLCAEKLAARSRTVSDAPDEQMIAFGEQEPIICAQVQTQGQYDACRAAGIESVYFKNVIPRNNCLYGDMEGELLIGGLGGIGRYRATNPFITDYSMNIVNSRSCREMHRLGARRVTLSLEINRRQIRELIDGYKRDNGGMPTLELIVYGRAPLMVMKYCPLRRLGKCGECTSKRFELDDGYARFPLQPDEDCMVTVLNGKTLNLLDEIPEISGIQAFRLAFTTETPEEVERIAGLALGKLDGSITSPVFDPDTDTRGHFNKRIQ